MIDNDLAYILFTPASPGVRETFGSAISPPFAGFSLPGKFSRPSTCGRGWQGYHTLAMPTFTDRPKRMFAPTMRSNLFRWNKRRRSRSAKLAQILTSFRSTQKEKSRHDQRGRPFYARGSTVMQGYYGRPEPLRSVFHPQPLYRGPQQPPWAPVWSLMLEGHMADAILLAKNRLAPTVE